MRVQYSAGGLRFSGESAKNLVRERIRIRGERLRTNRQNAKFKRGPSKWGKRTVLRKNAKVEKSGLIEGRARSWEQYSPSCGFRVGRVTHH